MDAAFGSHASTEDLEELENIQREVGLTNLLIEGEHAHTEKEGIIQVEGLK